MIASKNLKKQIIIEIGALLFLIGVILYAAYAIRKNDQNFVNNTDGFVTVLDDSKFSSLQILSDGEGLNTNGIKYTVTNNNENETVYKVILIPSTDSEIILSQIKVSVDDLYIENLSELEKQNNGYVILTHKLKPGYTKNHIIKIWYKLGSNSNVKNEKISFDYQLTTQ